MIRSSGGKPLGVGHPQDVFGGFNYYYLVILFFNIVPLQARTGRGIHGLPKVSPRPAQHDPYSIRLIV
jgi:hypothetical protein